MRRNMHLFVTESPFVPRAWGAHFRLSPSSVAITTWTLPWSWPFRLWRHAWSCGGSFASVSPGVPYAALVGPSRCPWCFPMSVYGFSICCNVGVASAAMFLPAVPCATGWQNTYHCASKLSFWSAWPFSALMLPSPCPGYIRTALFS